MNNIIDLGINPELSLYRINNWIPFFFVFGVFKNILNSPEKRIINLKIINMWIYSCYFFGNFTTFTI